MPLHRPEKLSLSKLTASPLWRVRNSSFGMWNHDPSPLITELVPALSSTHEHGQKETLGQVEVPDQGHKNGLRAVTCLAVTVQIKTLILLVLTNTGATRHKISDLEGNHRNDSAPDDRDNDTF